MIVYSEGGDPAKQDEADRILGILCATYPGHPWAVRVDGGIIFIRHLAHDNSNWGMNIKVRDVYHDAAVLKREIIMGAGEFLERAGLVRGRANDDEIIQVEGVPEKQRRKPVQLTPTEFSHAEERQAHRQMSGLHEVAENIGRKNGS